MSKTDLFLLRRKKKIRLHEIASYMNCSVSYLSYYENDIKSFDEVKARQYEEFIINYVETKK